MDNLVSFFKVKNLKEKVLNIQQKKQTIIAWRPRKMDSNEYLVVDFQSRVIITSLATQGRRAAREYVTLYALQYSDNGQNWFYYTDQHKIIMVRFFFVFEI